MYRELTCIDGAHSDPTSPGGRRLRWAAAIVVALATGVLTSSAPAAEPREPLVTLDQLRELPPIYGLIYRLGDADRRISTAKQELIRACMAAQGLAYVPHIEQVTRQQALAALKPFGPETLGAPAPAASPQEVPADDRHARALFGDPDRQVVARGERLEVSAPADGCIAEAEHRLLGDARVRGTELRLRLFDGERDAREQLDRDLAFGVANERWRACMREAGVDAADPLQLFGTLPPETDVAAHPAIRADIACKASTGYLVAGYTRLAALQQAWLDAHRGIAEEWTDLRHHQDTVAIQVLNGH